MHLAWINSSRLISAVVWQRFAHYQAKPAGCCVVIIIIIMQLLWLPYVIGQTIIFLPCDFFISSFYFLA